MRESAVASEYIPETLAIRVEAPLPVLEKVMRGITHTHGPDPDHAGPVRLDAHIFHLGGHTTLAARFCGRRIFIPGRLGLSSGRPQVVIAGVVLSTETSTDFFCNGAKVRFVGGR